MLVVTDKSSLVSLTLSNVVEDVVRADVSETVMVVDLDDSVSLPGVFNTTGVVAAFSESGDTNDSSSLSRVFVVNGAVIGVV